MERVHGEPQNLIISMRNSPKGLFFCALNNEGRLAIITFHSLEDKIVKHTYEDLEGRCTCPKSFPVCVCNFVSYGKIINKKPITSKEDELIENPRARSAKLREKKKKK